MHELRPLRDVRRLDASEFEASGADPQMLWTPPDIERSTLSAFRSIRVTVRLELVDGTVQDPCIYLDWGDSFSEDTRYALSGGLDALTAVASSNAGALRRVRFDPTSGACRFRLLGFKVEGVDSLLPPPPRLSLARRWARRILRKTPMRLQNAARAFRRFVLSDNAYRRRVLSRLSGGWLAGPNLWRAHYQHSFAVARQWRSPEFAAKPLEAPRRDPKGARVIAFYLPQYHPIPENDAWWGPGFTEWTNVSKATPQFEGHLQPRLPADLGFYDLRLESVRRAQADLARCFGVDAFCFHYYWFAGRRLLEQPLDAFVSDDQITTPFALSWANENWTRRWDGAESQILIGQNHSPEDDIAVFDDIARYLASPRYLRIGGRPLLTIYRPDTLPNAAETTKRWRGRARELGIGEIFLTCTNAFGFSQYKEAGFDGLVEFPPHAVSIGEITAQAALLNPDFSGRIYDYNTVVSHKTAELTARTDPRYFPGVMPAWDNEARKPGAGHVFHNAGPAAFNAWMAAALQVSRRLAPVGERLVFINAWNEWAEGAYLEPDRWFGHAFGHGVRTALENEASRITADDPRLMTRPWVQRRRAVALVHLHYADLIDNFAESLKPLSDRLDIAVTFSDLWSPDDLERLTQAFPAAFLIPVPNRGRDIGPFIAAMAWARDRYDVFLKLHSKRSPHLPDGDRWRERLLAPLIESSTATRVLARFAAEPKLGFVAAAETRTPLGTPNVLVNNRLNLDALAKSLGFAYDTATPFSAGSMFWGRVRAFDALVKAESMPFETELGRIDGGLAHAFERAFPAMVASAGFSIEFDL